MMRTSSFIRVEKPQKQIFFFFFFFLFFCFFSLSIFCCFSNIFHDVPSSFPYNAVVWCNRHLSPRCLDLSLDVSSSYVLRRWILTIPNGERPPEVVRSCDCVVYYAHSFFFFYSFLLQREKNDNRKVKKKKKKSVGRWHGGHWLLSQCRCTAT